MKRYNYKQIFDLKELNIRDVVIIKQDGKTLSHLCIVIDKDDNFLYVDIVCTKHIDVLLDSSDIKEESESETFTITMDKDISHNQIYIVEKMFLYDKIKELEDRLDIEYNLIKKRKENVYNRYKEEYKYINREKKLKNILYE